MSQDALEFINARRVKAGKLPFQAPGASITGFDLVKWQRAGDVARVRHGLPYPEPSWNPVYVSELRSVWEEC
jgi:hypothetical protein